MESQLEASLEKAVAFSSEFVSIYCRRFSIDGLVGTQEFVRKRLASAESILETNINVREREKVISHLTEIGRSLNTYHTAISHLSDTIVAGMPGYKSPDFYEAHQNPLDTAEQLLNSLSAFVLGISAHVQESRLDCELYVKTLQLFYKYSAGVHHFLDILQNAPPIFEAIKLSYEGQQQQH